MIVTANSISTIVNIKEYSVDYETSVTWKTVGSKHKGIDRGLSADKFSSEITVRNAGNVIAALRSLILSASNNGNSVTIKCEVFETIFGPEFNYDDYTYECVIEEDEGSYDTDSLNTNTLTEWTFTAFPMCNMSERYLRDTGLFPSTLSMISAKRIDNGARILANADTSRNIMGFGFSAPTCEIEYEGTLEEVADAKTFLQKLRTNYFEFSAALVWPFNLGVTNVNVYCLDIDDNGPLDKTSQWHSFTVVYGYAGAAIPVWDGVTVTTPALVDGYYEIYDGATLAGFKTLAVHNKKGKLISDIILNANHENYLTWDTTPPANDWNIPTTPNVYVAELNGNGHTIYGFYSSQNKSLLGGTNRSVSNLIHHLRVKNFTYKTSDTGSRMVLPLGDYSYFQSANSIHNVEMIGYMNTTTERGYFGPFAHEINAEKCIHSCVSRVKIYNSTDSSYSCGGIFGYGSKTSSAWNCGFMGSINVKANSGNGLIGGLSAKAVSNPGVSNNCFCSAVLTKRGSSAGVAAIHPSVIGLNCHYDSTLIPASYGGNTGCTGHPTEYFYTQAFIDELNSTLPAGCTPWKLGLDGYPTLDF